MSTRAQIAIQIGPEEWAHVYVHFDGYPAHMLPALASWKPEDILNAIEIRQVTPEALDCFTPKPRTAPAQRAQATAPKLVYPTGRPPYSHAPQLLGHDLEEPEPWAWDGGKRREQVLDHNFWPPRVVRSVGWRCCMMCSKAYFSQDVIRQRLCDGCRPSQPPW